MKKIFLLIISFSYLSIYSVPEADKIFEMESKCWDCADYFDKIQLKNNIVIRISRTLSSFENWLKSKEATKFLVNNSDRINHLFNEIKRSYNEIYSHKINKLSGYEEYLRNLYSYISEIDQSLPDRIKFVRIGFIAMVEEFIKTFDDLEELSKPYDFDNWVKEYLAIRPFNY